MSLRPPTLQTKLAVNPHHPTHGQGLQYTFIIQHTYKTIGPAHITLLQLQPARQVTAAACSDRLCCHCRGWHIITPSSVTSVHKSYVHQPPTTGELGPAFLRHHRHRHRHHWRMIAYNNCAAERTTTGLHSHNASGGTLATGRRVSGRTARPKP